MIGLILASNLWVVIKTIPDIHNKISDVPEVDVALILGTSKFKVGGGLNPFFKNRMTAAVDLYQAGKVKHLLVSGDNSTRYYNEPKRMKEELVSLGVPEEHITLDYAGLRTLDSIVRCKEVFGQDSFVIVTQKFHNHRAVFIGQFYGLNVSGYVAGNIPLSESFNVLIREYLARTLAIIDLYILQTSPKFLGEKEDLDI